MLQSHFEVLIFWALLSLSSCHKEEMCVHECSVVSVISNSLRPMDCGPPGSSVQGVLQASILAWVAMLSSRGSSWPRNRTCISCIAGGFFTHWTTWEAPQRGNTKLQCRASFSERSHIGDGQPAKTISLIPRGKIYPWLTLAPQVCWEERLG